MEMPDEPPYDSVDRNVCSECVVDSVLGEIVRNNLASDICDYCGNESEQLIAAPFDAVMSRIYESIITEYADAEALSLPWVDGEWLLEDTSLYDVVGDFDPGWSREFLGDVLESLGWERYWIPHCGGDWNVSDPGKTLRYGWKRFKEQILFKTRYLFLSEPFDQLDYGHPDYIPVSAMLEALGEVINGHNLFRNLPANTLLYRARVAPGDQTFSTFEEMGVPPHSHARAGRMNPPGIPYLYLATDRDTATLETIVKPVRYGLAEFATLRDLRLIDLANVPNPPSAFLPDRYQERHERDFLKHLQAEIAMSIERDGREHVEYVPTQVVSEYLRHRFRDSDGRSVAGIMYPSAKKSDGVNMALFVSDNDAASDLVGLRTVTHHLSLEGGP